MNIAIVVLFLIAILSPALGGDSLSIPQEGRVIFVNQLRQNGAAFENGVKLFDFEVITGDDVKVTEPGEYVVKKKIRNYFSRTHGVWMPYSLFFIWNERDRKAIHEGKVPPRKKREVLATNGCVHVAKPYAVRLFNWAEEGKTKIIIFGERSEE